MGCKMMHTDCYSEWIEDLNIHEFEEHTCYQRNCKEFDLNESKSWVEFLICCNALSTF